MELNERKSVILTFFKGIILPLMCLFGLCANIITAFAIHSKKLSVKNLTRHFMEVLAIFDTLILVLFFATICIEHWSTEHKYYTKPYLIVYLFPFLKVRM